MIFLSIIAKPGRQHKNRPLPWKSYLVARKQGRCAQKALAGKEFDPEIRLGFRRVWRALYRAGAGRAIGRPTGRPYNGITLFLGRKWFARPA